MTALRISHGGLMALMAIARVGTAALHNAPETWAGVVLLATLGLPVALYGCG